MPSFRVRLHFDRLTPREGHPDQGWCDHDHEAATLQEATTAATEKFTREYGDTHRITKVTSPGQVVRFENGSTMIVGSPNPHAFPGKGYQSQLF